MYVNVINLEQIEEIVVAHRISLIVSGVALIFYSSIKSFPILAF